MHMADFTETELLDALMRVHKEVFLPDMERLFDGIFEAFRTDMNAGFARIIGKLDDIIEVHAEFRRERT